MENVLLKAAQRKYRFDTEALENVNGNLTIEGLFDLGQTQLDTLYRHYAGKVTKGKGLLSTKPDNAEAKDKMQIIESVFLIKKEQAEAQQQAERNKERKQRLLAHADEVAFQEMVDGKSAKDLVKQASKL